MIDYDLDRWSELVEQCPDLADCPEHRRADTLWQAFGIPEVSAPRIEPVYVPHEWRRKTGGTVDGFYVGASDGYYTCTTCGRIELGAYCISTHGDAWYEAPRHAGSCGSAS